MTPDIKLTDHFWLSEFLRSETADRLGIDNTPPERIIDALRYNASCLEAVRTLLAAPLHVSSGFRCLSLNRVLRSKDTSAHVRGLATDFEAPGFGTPLEICRAIKASDITFDQLIFEHTWVHIGWATPGTGSRREVLTLLNGGAYAPGIIARAP